MSHRDTRILSRLWLSPIVAMTECRSRIGNLPIGRLAKLQLDGAGKVKAYLTVHHGFDPRPASLDSREVQRTEWHPNNIWLILLYDARNRQIGELSPIGELPQPERPRYHLVRPPRMLLF